jgi:hypothetical protein
MKCLPNALHIFLGVLYVNVNVKFYKTTRVWNEGGKLFTNVYARG